MTLCRAKIQGAAMQKIAHMGCIVGGWRFDVLFSFEFAGMFGMFLKYVHSPGGLKNDKRVLTWPGAYLLVAVRSY